MNEVKYGFKNFKTSPLVFNYANYVTPQFVANVVNVVGGSPIMAREIAEFPDLVGVSDAVVINTGTWRRAELLETIKLAQLANQAKKLWSWTQWRLGYHRVVCLLKR